MHILINSISGDIHQFRGTIHNLKKFFAFWQRKYTPAVYKDLSANILLSKKENITSYKKNFPPGYGGKLIF